MNIHLHIDHLVLDGLPVEPSQGDRVQAAVEAELTRLIASGALTPSLRMGGAYPSVPSQDIHLTGHDTATTLGQQIGQAVYGGISR